MLLSFYIQLLFLRVVSFCNLGGGAVHLHHTMVQPDGALADVNKKRGEAPLFKILLFLCMVSLGNLGSGAVRLHRAVASGMARLQMRTKRGAKPLL